ncbi:uncharacterized protein [Venturia canescens]|uniref:uncharacterized protein isoform X2 n=1 Tax=Venturia canescens TaxID=32260 RepID=UPI001C9D060E|nr:uncharacterized protein LOC122408072 isoform X2 [Venturia canescens]
MNRMIILTNDVNLRPTSYVYVNAGQWVTVWFEGNDTDVTACKLKATAMDKEYDLFNYQFDEMTRYRGCGVKILATKERALQWELRRNIGDYVIETSIFHIQVPYENDDPRRVINRHLIIGKPAKLEVRETDMLFCQIIRPDGSTTRIQYGVCEVEIPAVTTFHYGTWIASFALKGKMELDSTEIDVELWDLDSLDAKIIPGSGPELNLLCRTGVSSLKFCTFIRPDKYTINLPVGVGNENYSYYGDGYKDDTESRYYADCGITIHNPSDDDFGLWNCEMGVQQGNSVETRGTVIEVNKSRSGRSYNVKSSDVIVKRGETYSIRCKVNAKLDYCWLRSPNGTVFSISSEISSLSSIKYIGKGFTMGDCGTVVNNAQSSDNGTWTCHLGLSGGTEVMETILVQVADSYLIATEKIVQIKDVAKLSCKIFSGESGALKYCRWVRPDGYGIHYQDAWRYTMFNDRSSCVLNIPNVTSEDIGMWTCAGMLTGNVESEQSAFIQLEWVANDMTTINVLSIILGCGILVFTLISVFFAAMFLNKRKKIQQQMKRPPAYDPEDFAQPRSFPPVPNEPAMDKDYKY